MIDSATYERYSKPLEDQMFYIADLGVPLLTAINAADVAGADRDFIADIRILKAELDGKPRDAALEVYRDLPLNIKTAKSILDKWQSTKGSEIQIVLGEVRKTYDALLYFEKLIDGTPPHVLREIKRTIAIQRVTAHRSVTKVLLPILVPLLAVLAFKMWGVVAMIVVAWAGLILYLKMK
jgi:hypothetical protein